LGDEPDEAQSKSAQTLAPSRLYRAGLWQAGLATACKLPPAASARLSQSLARAYWSIARARREAVIQNLLPPLEGDRAKAEKVGQRLFRNFGIKLVDLFRYET